MPIWHWQVAAAPDPREPHRACALVKRRGATAAWVACENYSRALPDLVDGRFPHVFQAMTTRTAQGRLVVCTEIVNRENRAADLPA